MSNFGMMAAIGAAFVAEREAHVTVAPETAMEAQLEEAKTLFPAGRIVRLKSGGPNMTVQRVYIYDDGSEDEGIMVDCLWFQASYHPAALSATASGGAGGSVEYGRDVQQFDFHPDTITGV